MTSSITTSPERWRDFVSASPYADVLQLLEWGELKKPEWQPVPLAIETDGATKATALVLKRKLQYGRVYLGRNFFYAPRGPIVDWSDPDATRDIVASMRAAASQHRATFIKIDPAVPESTPGIRERILELGFLPSPDATGHFGGTQPRCNMKLSLEGTLDDVQARFHQKWRYNIRLAQKKGLTVQSECTRAELAVFHDIYRLTAGRNKFTGRPLSYFEKMWDVLVPAGLMKLFIVRHEERPLSAAICFLLGPQCWYVYGASSNADRNLMPNHLMQWTMIGWAKSQGASIYDFRGVPDPESSHIPPEEEGLVRFKTGFGAELVRYCGEFDLPLDKNWYWMWTTGRPRLVTALKRLKRLGKK